MHARATVFMHFSCTMMLQTGRTKRDIDKSIKKPKQTSKNHLHKCIPGPEDPTECPHSSDKWWWVCEKSSWWNYVHVDKPCGSIGSGSHFPFAQKGWNWNSCYHGLHGHFWSSSQLSRFSKVLWINYHGWNDTLTISTLVRPLRCSRGVFGRCSSSSMRACVWVEWESSS